MTLHQIKLHQMTLHQMKLRKLSFDILFHKNLPS